MVRPEIVQYALKRKIVVREAQNGRVTWRVTPRYTEYNERMKALDSLRAGRERASKVEKEAIDSLVDEN